MKTTYIEKNKIIERTLAIFAFIALILSLLPIFYCSLFNYATGDDLWCSRMVKRAIVTEGTATAFLRALVASVKDDYFGWDGNWASSILWSIQPSVWGEKIYIVTSFIGILSVGIGVAYFLHYFFNKYLKTDRYFFITIYSCVCLLIFQYMPSPRNLFWYTGMIQYFFAFGWYLASIVWIDKYFELGKKRFLIYLILLMTYMGGAGYLTMVLSFETLILMAIYQWFINKTTKKAYSLLIPLLLLTIGFLICAMSPGVSKRSGGDLEFSIGRIFNTLWKCQTTTISDIKKYFSNIKILIPITFFTVFFIWSEFDIEKIKITGKRAAALLLLLFEINASVRAPEIYAEDSVSGGVPDTYWMVFVITHFIGIIILIGFIKDVYNARYKSKLQIQNKYIKYSIKAIVCMILLVYCWLFKGNIIKGTYAYTCVDFIRTGQLKDFDEQMKQRIEILNDDTITDVVLPSMNDEQGPFLHMCVVSNPNAYTNQATAWFYGKDSVIAIPREEWDRIYQGAETNQ